MINRLGTTRIDTLALAALVSARGMEDVVAQEGNGAQAMPMPATADEMVRATQIFEKVLG